MGKVNEHLSSTLPPRGRRFSRALEKVNLEYEKGMDYSFRFRIEYF